MKSNVTLAALGMFSAAAVAPAAVITFNMDSATVGGVANVVKFDKGVSNITQDGTTPFYSFDTTVKDEGSASLRLHGSTGAKTYGHFLPYLDLKTLSGGSAGMDLTGKNTSLSFRFRSDYESSPPIGNQTYLRLTFYKGGPEGTGTLLRQIDVTNTADDVNGSWTSVSVPITNAAGALLGSSGTGIVSDVDYIVIGYWHGSFTGRTLDAHIDNVQLSGEKVAIPEPTSAAALLGAAGVLMARRRRL